MIHNTHMAQFIPVTLFHPVTGTFTWVAGDVAGTIAMNRAAANETSVVNIPITLPSNSIALQGCKLTSIEIDYEVKVAEPTSITPTINKVTRGIDTAVAVVAAVTQSAQSPVAASAKTVDQHKLLLTPATPFWIDNDEYVLVELSIVAGAGGNTMKFLGAVANFTFRA